MKLTSKSEAIQKKEDVPQVLEAEIIENDIYPVRQTVPNGSKRSLSPIYIAGQLIGSLGSILLKLLNSGKVSRTLETMMSKGSGLRRKRNRRRGKAGVTGR